MLKQTLVLSVLVLSAIPALANTTEPAKVLSGDGVALSGEWVLPAGPVKGVAVILQGSGNVDRDGDVSGPLVGMPDGAPTAKLSLQLAETLAKANVASLRYDKRGVEDSKQLPNQITSVLARDADAAYELARTRFPEQKLLLVGFSEGALVAALVARHRTVDALLLLSAPTRSIDEALRYVFVDWPVSRLKTHLTVDSEGSVALSELAAKGVTRLPLSGLLTVLDKPLADFDRDHDGRLSLEHEVLPAYAEQGWTQVQALLGSPGFSGWYNDMKALPALRDFASELKTSRVIIYQGSEDTQNNAEWAQQDLFSFPGRVTLRPFAGLGHCFSAMRGPLGEIKTSGPFADSLLDAVERDARALAR